MSRKKARRFVEARENINVLESGNELFEIIKGNWNGGFFKNENPIVLEVGCGKGEYTVGLAKIFPEKNFIGIDIKGDRIAVGSNYAIENNLTNVGFLRTKVHDILNFFGEGEVSEIWITFPDPQPLKSGIKKRLTNERFLEMYKSILNLNGTLHLKTDSELLFDYTLDTIRIFGTKNLVLTKDLYNSDLNIRHFGIKTRFEEIFTEKGFLINYLSCEFTP
ncbi:MAG: tRNA (guanosine(46)-N7)-methyltransferase TrmB [Arcicella sp.]|nr:tRNA (guanosine(46)-N7)-methyltransferase TrmB [Arcicella sp.]